MKIDVGDLITFKPKYIRGEEYSEVAVILKEFATCREDSNKLWVVWSGNEQYIVDEKTHSIMHVIGS